MLLVKELVIYHNIPTVPTTKVYYFIPVKLTYHRCN